MRFILLMTRLPIGHLVILFLHIVFIYHFGILGAVCSSIIWSLLVVLFVFAMISNKSKILIIAFLLSLTATTLISLGVFYGINLFKTKVLPTATFFIVSGLIFGSAIIYYGILYARYTLPRMYQRKHFVHMSFKIFHFNEMPIILTQLQFSNTTNNRESNINLFNSCRYYTQKEISAATIKTRIKMMTSRAFFNTVKMPHLSDTLRLSYYSIVEDRYYSDAFKFPYKQLKLSKRFDLNGKPDGDELEDIFLLIKPQGKIDLCNEQNQLLHTYTCANKSLANETKEQITEHYISTARPKWTRQNYLQMVNEINASNLLAKAEELHELAFNWKMSFEGPTQINDIVLTHLLYIDQFPSYEDLQTVSKKPVPNEIKLNVTFSEDYKTVIMLNIDREKLYPIVQAMLAENKEEPVEFLILIKDAILDSNKKEFQKSKKAKVPYGDSSMIKDELEKEQIQFFVKTQKETVEFTYWETGYPNFDLLKYN